MKEEFRDKTLMKASAHTTMKAAASLYVTTSYSNLFKIYFLIN